MKIQYDPLLITGDDAIIAKVEKLGVDLATVDISDLQVDADTLARLYSDAEAKGDSPDVLLRYAAMKKAFTERIEMAKKRLEDDHNSGEDVEEVVEEPDTEE